MQRDVKIAVELKGCSQTSRRVEVEAVTSGDEEQQRNRKSKESFLRDFQRKKTQVSF